MHGHSLCCGAAGRVGAVGRDLLRIDCALKLETNASVRERSFFPDCGRVTFRLAPIHRSLSDGGGGSARAAGTPASHTRCVLKLLSTSLLDLPQTAPLVNHPALSTEGDRNQKRLNSPCVRLPRDAWLSGWLLNNCNGCLLFCASDPLLLPPSAPRIIPGDSQTSR